MAPRRVTYLIWSLARGGAERQLAELVHALDPARFEARVIVRRAGVKNELQLPVAPTSLGLSGGWTPRGFSRLVRALRAPRPDILHTVMDPENLHGRLAARVASVPRVVASVRCPVLPLATRLSERLTQGLVHHWIVNSRGIRDALQRDAALPTARVSVIENGVRSDHFTPLDPLQRSEIRSRWGVDRGSLWVLPGRISREKNQRLFLDAIARAHRVDGLTVVLPGDAGLDAEYVRSVRRAAEAAGPTRVSLPGVVGDMATLLAAADAVFVPSEYEGLSNAVIEAMACGALVVVSDGANVDALISDGVDGLVLGTATATNLARAFERLGALPRGELDAMRAAARETAVRRFSVRAMASSTMDLYDRVLADLGPIHRG